MALVQKNVNGTEYYTDDKVYYTFHRVQSAQDTLWDFACLALGITKKTGFNSQETKAITDLAGIGPRYPSKFLMLKNGKAMPIAYLFSGSPNLRPNDIILRSAVSLVASGVSKPLTNVSPSSVSTKSIAERLKEIENLHNMELLTDQEYKDKRAKLIAEL